MGEPWVVACAVLLVGSVVLRLVPAHTYDDDDLTPEEVGYLRAGRRRVRLLTKTRRRLGLPTADGATRAALVERGLVAPARRHLLAVWLVIFAAGLAGLTYVESGPPAQAPATVIFAASALVFLTPWRPVVARWALRNARARFEQRIRRAPSAASAELALLMVAFEGRLALDVITTRSAVARAVAASAQRPVRRPSAVPTLVATAKLAPVKPAPVKAAPVKAAPLRPRPTPARPVPHLTPLTFVPAAAPSVPQLEWHALVPRSAAVAVPASQPAPAAVPAARRRITFLGVARVPSVALRHQPVPAPRTAPEPADADAAVRS